MATVTASTQQYLLEHEVTTWAALKNGDSGSPSNHGGVGNCSVQIEGTFGVGGNVIIEGSNDGTNYHTLNDPGGASLGTVSSAGLFGVREEVLYIRPRVSAGDGTTSINVTFVVRKGRTL